MSLTPPGVHPDRVRVWTGGPPRPGPIVLWLMQAWRARENPALAHAVALANAHGRSVVVLVTLESLPEPTARTQTFVLAGLRELQAALRARSIGFHVALGDPASVASTAAASAGVLVTDRAYLRAPRAALARVAASAPCPVVTVEGEAIVPVDVASPKAEWAARTIRPKLTRLVDHYLDPVGEAEPTLPWRGPALPLAPHPDVTDALREPDRLMERWAGDRLVGGVAAAFPGGERAAHDRLERFVTGVLAGYAEDRNQPQRAGVSYLGMYLRHGMISPALILRRVRAAAAEHPAHADGAAVFAEELLVRRELSINHVERTPDHGSFASLPAWARATLAAHTGDPREHLYDDDALTSARSHDPYWNAAMVELRDTGYMHNHMRMYWGKKVLEWTREPERAYERLLAWNNRYLLDGHDPNSFVGVGWVFGLHDRPWAERPIFGTVRSMTAAGLRRKADPDAYVRKVQARARALAREGEG